MAKKLLFVTLLLVLAIASVDLVVDVSAQPGEMLGDMADKTADVTKSPIDQTASTSLSWAEWVKKQFQGMAGGGSKNDEESGSPASAPSVGA